MGIRKRIHVLPVPPLPSPPGTREGNTLHWAVPLLKRLFRDFFRYVIIIIFFFYGLCVFPYSRRIRARRATRQR